MLNKMKYIDLFSGIGGFHQALNEMKSNCVFASEWDKDCQEVYFKNYGITPEGDITKIHEKDIPSHDIICAGFPCQAFSISGKQLGFNDSRGTLFFEVARIIKYHKPKILFLENVKNFATHDNGNTLKLVKTILNELGYDVHYKVLNSSNFGVAQKRERIYILGFRKDLNVKEFTFPTSYGTPTRLLDVCLPNSQTKKYIRTRDDMILKNIRISKNSDGHYPLIPIRIGVVNKGGQGERIYHQNGHSITLSAYGGGLGAKTGLYKIRGKVRKLAPRECARLTGFPETFKIPENDNIAYKQFGNSVVVPVLVALLKQIESYIK